MTLNLHLTQSDVDYFRKFKNIKYSRYIRQRAEVLILHAHGISTLQIVSITGLCELTIRTYLHEYKKQGKKIFCRKEAKPRPTKLLQFEEIIREDFSKCPPHTAAQATRRIFELTGIKRGCTQVRVFLKSIGMSYKKSSSYPAKCNPVEQEDFKKNFGTSHKRSKSRPNSCVLS